MNDDSNLTSIGCHLSLGPFRFFLQILSYKFDDLLPVTSFRRYRLLAGVKRLSLRSRTMFRTRKGMANSVFCRILILSWRVRSFLSFVASLFESEANRSIGVTPTSTSKADTHTGRYELMILRTPIVGLKPSASSILR